MTQLSQPSSLRTSSRYKLGKRLFVLTQVSLGLAAAFGGFAIAAGNPTGSSPALAAERARVRWTPKKDRGNAKGTLSGGRRGQESSACGPEATATRLKLLVPEGRASLITTSSQPTFSWQVATEKPASMTFILSDMSQPTPVYTQTLEGVEAGLTSVTLPKTAGLEDETRYRWTVILDCPEGQKSEIYARSFIRKTSGESLEQQLVAEESAVAQAAIFAEKGVWYDALGRLVNAPSSDAGNSKAALELLLDQGVPD